MPHEQESPPEPPVCLTDTMIGNAPLLYNEEFRNFQPSRATVPMQASYERTRLEQWCHWGLMRGVMPPEHVVLPASIVRRYRSPSAEDHHRALCLAFAREARPTNAAPLGVSDATQRVRIVLRQEQRARAASQNSVQETSFGSAGRHALS